jgi:hypothetical protein
MNEVEKKKISVILPLIPCPNCNGRFYPHDFGMTNIRCSDCGYEAIFQMMEGAQRQLAFTIEKEDADMMMAQKVLMPPAILYWSWKLDGTNIQMEAADLYPFIPYTFLRVADVSLSLSGQPNKSLVFLQSDDLLPKMRIYSSPSDDDEIAHMVSSWEKPNTSRIQRIFEFGYARAARIMDKVKEIRRKKGLPDGGPSIEDDEEEEE